MSKRPHRFAVPMLALGASALALAACSQEQVNASTAAEAQTPAAAVTADSEVVAVGETVANFSLSDQNGVEHSLYDYDEADAVVLVMQGNGCPIVQKMLPTLKEVASEYSAKNVEFLMVNAFIQDNPEKIKAEDEKFAINMPILKDQSQDVSRYLGAVRTAEVYVVDPENWELIYHGPLDDRLTYGREKAVADNHYVRDVLDATLAGAELPHPEKLEADGCLINYV